MLRHKINSLGLITIIICLLLLSWAVVVSARENLSSAKEPGFFSFSVQSIDKKKVDFINYKGKVILAVNVASQCGYTPQYAGLENLYEKFKARGFIILGFPSNDFGGQEPGSNAEIKKFCHLKYQVTFPIFSKVNVTGSSKIQIYQFLTNSSPDDQRGEVKWNFEKFLIGRDGRVLNRFRSEIEPQDPTLIQVVEHALDAK